MDTSGKTRCAQLVALGLNQQQVSEILVVSDRTVRRWQKTAEFRKELERLHAQQSLEVAELKDLLQISALLWANEYMLSDSAKANVKAQIFGKIFTHTSSTRRQVADPNDDRAFQFIMGELDKIAHFRQSNGAQNTG